MIIRTDHKALSGRLTRWTMVIQDYNIQIEYCPGRDIVVADNLSQLSGQENCKKMGHNEGKITLYCLAKRPSLPQNMNYMMIYYIL